MVKYDVSGTVEFPWCTAKRSTDTNHIKNEAQAILLLQSVPVQWQTKELIFCVLKLIYYKNINFFYQFLLLQEIY